MKKRHIISCTAACILMCSFSYGQSSPDSQTAIAKLISDFQTAAVSGAPLDHFFTPSTRLSDKRQITSLQSSAFVRFTFADYNLSKDLKVLDARHATLRVTVRWETKNEEASKTSNLMFEEDQGLWYFSDASFWTVSIAWMVPLIVLGVAYGSGFTFIYWHSSRQHWLNPKKRAAWQVLAIVPFSFLFYLVRRPWVAA